MKRNHTKILSVTLAAALIGSLLAIPTAAEATKKLKVTSPKSVTVGKTIKIKTNMKCKYKSSNKKIATVSSKGVVKGKKAGKVKITVTAQSTKKKKTVSITVKKQPENKEKEKVAPSPNVEETPNPSATVTQPTQPNVTQPSAPTPSEGASQSPDIPVTPKPFDPVEESPDVSETPDVGQTSKPVTTETPSPDLPSTQKPSASPEPTSTATSSPTTPSATRQPIGITAEYEGKIPINRELSNEATAMSMLIDDTVIVKLIYDDNTEEQVSPQKLYIKQKVVEENGTKYVEATVKYEEFTTLLKVELVDVPKDVLYPIYIDCSYVGDILKKNQIPNLEDIKTQAIMVDRSITDVSSTQIRIADIKDLYETEGKKEYRFMIVHDYYFDFNGQVLHAAEGDLLYIPYE